MQQAQDHLVIHNDKDCGVTKFDSGLYKHIVGGRFGHTSDKDAHDRLDKIEAKQAQLEGVKPLAQFAEEPEYEVVIDSKTE